MATRTRIDVRWAGEHVRVRLHGGQLTPRRLPDEDGVVRVALVATEALLLAGDAVSIEVAVGEGIRLEVVEVAGTVAYDMRGSAATWAVDIALDREAELAWVGLPFVVAEGARVRRRTVVRLGEGASAVVRETLVLGRTGEAGGRLDSSFTATLAGRPLLVESLTLDPVSRSDPGLLGGARCLDVVTSLGRRIDHPRALQLEGDGSVLRWLGDAVHDSDLGPLVARVVATRRAHVQGRDAPPHMTTV